MTNEHYGFAFRKSEPDLQRAVNQALFQGCLAIYSESYQTEIVRGAIQSIDTGQIEAARSLGLSSYQAMRYVVLPQAFLRMLPPLGNEFVALTKNSALVSLVTVQELLLTAQMIISTTFQDVAMFLTIGIIYYVLTTLMSSLDF